MVSKAENYAEIPEEINGYQQGIRDSQWIENFESIAKIYHLSPSQEEAKQALKSTLTNDEKARIFLAAHHLGLDIELVKPTDFIISQWHLPLSLKLKTGDIALVKELFDNGNALVHVSGEKKLDHTIPIAHLLTHADFIVLARPNHRIQDSRVDNYIQPYQENWLRKIIFSDISSYKYVMYASLLANILGVSGIIFSMQVYDRVIPAQSFNTLYVLFSGVLCALFFDFLMRRVRADILDLSKKRVDMVMSDRVFGHMLRIRNKIRLGSAGSLIAQLRDLEQIREVLSSTTVSVICDLPFFILFLGLFWVIGQHLVIIPICGFFLIVIPGLLVQGRLRAYSKESMRETSLRNALLVEAVQGLEDIKTLQAEQKFQHQWNFSNATTGEAGLKLKALTNSLGIWTHSVQLGIYVLTIFVGAPMVIEGTLSTGALISISILSSRMMVPITQMSHIATRWQHARIAKKGLDQIMQMPIDHPKEENRIHKARINGNYSFKSALFQYGDESSPIALSIPELHIKAGERIAILGKNASGKSTLLMALSGLLDASSGEILLDNTSLQHIDPADVRRDVGLVTQNSRLFFGSLRDNIIMGAPKATDAEIEHALKLVGADQFVKKIPNGLDYTIMEGGQGLSGGQKQAFLLARLLIRNPSVILLDEPTASMDEATERSFIEQLSQWSDTKTLVIATHRMRVLDLVNRILVIERGRIVLDETKELALRKLANLSKVSQTKSEN